MDEEEQYFKNGFVNDHILRLFMRDKLSTKVEFRCLAATRYLSSLTSIYPRMNIGLGYMVPISPSSCWRHRAKIVPHQLFITCCDEMCNTLCWKQEVAGGSRNADTLHSRYDYTQFLL